MRRASNIFKTNFKDPKTILKKIVSNTPIKQRLPEGGRINIENFVPFVLIHELQQSDPALKRMVLGEYPYIIATKETLRDSIDPFLEELKNRAKESFGFFLTIKIEGERIDREKPHFTIEITKSGEISKGAEILKEHLEEITLGKKRGEASLLLVKGIKKSNDICKIKIDTSPIYKKGDRIDPVALDKVHKGFAKACKKSLFAIFYRTNNSRHIDFTQAPKKCYTKIFSNIVRKLNEIEKKTEFLYLCEPINFPNAWEEFKASGYKKVPKLLYRPSTINVTHLKNELCRLDIEEIDDPYFFYNFLKKKEELNCKLDMIRYRDEEPFFAKSLQLYGKPDTDYEKYALKILTSNDDLKTESKAFAEKNESIFSPYIVEENSKVVVNGQFIEKFAYSYPVSDEIKIKTEIVASLDKPPIFDGAIFGHERLKEGISLCVSYINHGENVLKNLCAKYISALQMCGGYDFKSVFEYLYDIFNDEKKAFYYTVSSHRCGGFTRDGSLLEWFCESINFVKNGGDTAPLFHLKMGYNEIPLYQVLKKSGKIAPKSSPYEKVLQKISNLDIPFV